MHSTETARQALAAAREALGGVRPTEGQYAEMVRPTLTAFEEASGPAIKRVTDAIYESLLEGVQDYLRQNAEWNLGNDIRRADRIDRENNALRAELEAALERERALREAVMAVVEASRAHLTPGGISADEFINRVIGATDNPRINAVILEA